jgi:hypothetical protein
MLPWIVQLGYKAGAAAPTPTPSPAPPLAAHGSRKRRRHYVEIDGQTFPVEDAAEAVELLQRARAIAERQAEERGAKAVRALRRKPQVPKVRIAQPAISASPEIRAEVAPLIADISRLYDRAAELAEIRLLLARQIADDDDEDDVLLLI